MGKGPGSNALSTVGQLRFYNDVTKCVVRSNDDSDVGGGGDGGGGGGVKNRASHTSTSTGLEASVPISAILRVGHCDVGARSRFGRGTGLGTEFIMD
jgi:hypothetical protein